MELRVSSHEPDMSHDPEDKEISDDDDDRNHKHRRRDDTRLQSLEDDITEQLCTKPYRRGNKPSQNGPGSQSNITRKNYSLNPLEKDHKRPGFTHFPPDLNQKIRVNQRESSLWSQPYSVDPHGLFAGRGSNSWGPFGLVPGIPNGGLDLIRHPIGLQGTFRPPINPSLNMGISRQRCRDFEEQGFCLRGDMCPMEHGVNRIVVEDVQSLSQFNLPVSLPITNLSIPPAGTGPSPATTTTTTKNPHGKNTQPVDSSSNDADFYDPDQPLWGKDSHTTPAVPQPKTDSSLDPTPSANHDNEVFEGTTFKTQGTPKGRMVRKVTQRAERTLFVNGIPKENNKRETLISHFKRFGEVIDIYIPLNSERAFVQFSKREEAEAALMAPNAVMGNRFIKLWWANRDNIPTHGPTVSPYKRKDDTRSTLQNDVNAPVPDPAVENQKLVVGNGVKVVTPPLQKKLENLEVLKEELRKKQEMLDQKRNEFRRKLEKLAKQATGVKGDVAPEQFAKKQKLGDLDESTKTATPSSSDRDTILPSWPDDVAATQNSKTTLAVGPPQESPRLKPSVVPWTHVESQSPVVTNRFKLDNRPTAFKIVPPLPDGLADVPVLKDHFSAYGDISKVQLDDIEPVDPTTPKPSARIYFTTRHAAEKAFINGKIWNGQNLQFTWLNSNKVNSDSSNRPVVEIPKTDSQKLSTSGNGELEKREIVKEPQEEESNNSNLSKP